MTSQSLVSLSFSFLPLAPMPMLGASDNKFTGFCGVLVT